jgi:hypothetical protein
MVRQGKGECETKHAVHLMASAHWSLSLTGIVRTEGSRVGVIGVVIFVMVNGRSITLGITIQVVQGST